jgi:hypothetical protein
MMLAITPPTVSMPSVSGVALMVTNSAEVGLDELLHLGDACRPAHDQDLVDGRLLEARLLDHVLNWLECLLEEVLVEIL